MMSHNKKGCFHESFSLDQEMEMSELLTMISPENKKRETLTHSGRSGVNQFYTNSLCTVDTANRPCRLDTRSYFKPSDF